LPVAAAHPAAIAVDVELAGDTGGPESGRSERSGGGEVLGPDQGDELGAGTGVEEATSGLGDRACCEAAAPPGRVNGNADLESAFRDGIDAHVAGEGAGDIDREDLGILVADRVKKLLRVLVRIEYLPPAGDRPYVGRVPERGQRRQVVGNRLPQPVRNARLLSHLSVVYEAVFSDKVFVIGEAGSNWRAGTPARDRRMAEALIDVAAEAGCDAVKFQTYRAETVYVPNAGTTAYLADAGADEPVTDLFRDLEMPYELVPELAAHCSERGIEFMSTPFSLADLEAIDPHVSRHKVASFEITDVRLLEGVAGTGKPVILSTGASTLDDVETALETLRAAGSGPVCLLQCTSSYPAPPESMNLAVLPALARRFGVPVGLSDHSVDPVVGPVGAVVLGATVIEKHFTLHRALPGPDHSFAVTPEELGRLVESVRLAEQMRGQGEKSIGAVEEELHAFAQRRVQAIAPIRRGEPLEEGRNVASLRPGAQQPGVHPAELGSLEGRAATRDIALGDGIQQGDWET